MDLAKLRAPFAPERISWRVGSTTQDKAKGMALAYIDARDVMSRLDEVCGHLWQAEYVPMPNGTCCCRLGIKVGDEWVWRANGAINIADRDTVDAKEMSEKGSYSDAFKRAAVLWGIGQYLYDLDSPWVELDDKKRIVQSEYAKLRALLSKDAATVPKAAPAPANTQPAPKTPYDDPDGQMQAWIDQQKQFLTNCTTLEDVQGWEELRADAMKRLHSKNLKAWGELTAFKEARIRDLRPKEAAE